MQFFIKNFSNFLILKLLLIKIWYWLINNEIKKKQLIENNCKIFDWSCILLNQTNEWHEKILIKEININILDLPKNKNLIYLVF